jgi:hypothetical protein
VIFNGFKVKDANLNWIFFLVCSIQCRPFASKGFFFDAPFFRPALAFFFV